MCRLCDARRPRVRESPCSERFLLRAAAPPGTSSRTRYGFFKRRSARRTRPRARRPEGWTLTCDFSLGHYRELLEAAKAGGFRFAGFERPPQAGDLIIRHDVDLSLDAAVRMAEVEADAGARSTWCLMTRSAFYNLDSAAAERAVARLRGLGGTIAHHAVWPHVDLDDRFIPVVAWHNPEPPHMWEPIDGAVNPMTAPFFDADHYRSDSNQRWRHGCPHEGLARGEPKWLQLLIHPEIWVYDGATMGATMEAFLDADRAARLEHLRADKIDLS